METSANYLPRYQMEKKPISTGESSSRVDGREILRARAIRKSFGGQVVLDGASVDLHEGEVVLLRGDNGSGKTTLLNILTGNLKPDSGTVWLDADGTEEKFDFPFRWWQTINPFSHFSPERVANESIGRTWQDIRTFKSRSVLDNIAVATPNQPGENPLQVLIRNGGTRRFEKTNESECRELLWKLGLKEIEDASAERVSLGQAKRLAIARAVRAGARVLFLDEPLSGLDTDGIDEIINLLTALVEKDRLTLVIVEHVFNIPRILRVAHTVWTLSDGIVQSVEAQRILEDLPSEFDDVVKKLLGQFAKPECRVEECLLHGGARFLRITDVKAKPDGEVPVLDVRSLVIRRSYRLVIGYQVLDGAIQGLSFKLYRGDVGILCAPNGWGKSTLLEALVGILPSSDGQVFLRGVDLHQVPPWERVRRGLRMLTARNKLFPTLSIQEYLSLSNQPSERKQGRLSNLKQSIGELSGGERQQLSLDKLSIPNAVTLLDEPFLGLDARAARHASEQLWEATNRLNGTLLIALPSSPD